MGVNTCPNCSSENTPQASFCASCGNPLKPQPEKPAKKTPTCPRCSTPIRVSARFCPNCGYDVVKGEEPAQSPPLASPQSPTPAIHAATPTPSVIPPGGSPHTQLLSDSIGPMSLMLRWMGGNTQNFPISKPLISIGRAPDNDIVINHPAVSGHHLKLMSSPAGMSVTDLNSTNGTQLNGHRIPANNPQEIQPGAVLRIGDLTGNWVSITLEGAAGVAVRTLSLGKLDLTGQTDILIGRDPACYLPLNHPTVSYRHAQIYKQDSKLVIRDLGSTNGTYVNGRRINLVPLSSGDEIQIGPFKLVYDAQRQSLDPSMRLGHRIDAIKLGREVGHKKMILNDVTLTVNPGEFVAFVGGSGAGKSTLMKAMNGYDPANHGRILLDGEPLYEKLDQYRTQMGYVPQDDIIHRVLPVRKALWYAAKLRLPDARGSEINARIQDALRAVDMLEQADKPVKVLSGGQRKRVSIAVELLARPTLFFLDEPTSGLDPGLEKKMMYDLNRLSDEGRTVVLVTHATANIEQCDHVAFLSYGRMAFYGPPNEALSFFKVRDFSDIYLKLSQEIDPSKGKPVPPDLQSIYQPRSGDGKVNAGVLWAEIFRRSPQYQQFVADRQSQVRSGGAASRVAAPLRPAKDSFIRQTIILARRQFDLVRYDWRTLFVLLLIAPLLGGLFAMVSTSDDFVSPYKNIEDVDKAMKKELEKDGLKKDEKKDYLPTADTELLVTMIALALTQVGTFGAAYEIVKERAIYKRERAINLSVISYILSKVVVLGMFAFIQVGSFLVIIATVVDMGFRGSIISFGFLEIFFTLYLAVMASVALGLFISAIVPNTDIVLYAILVQLFIQIILCGTMFPLKNNPVMLGVPSHWAINSIGSSVNMDKLNDISRVCSAVEMQSPVDGSTKIEVLCDSGKRDLNIAYDHSVEQILYTWIGLSFHVLFWIILTIIVQARKKIE